LAHHKISIFGVLTSPRDATELSHSRHWNRPMTLTVQQARELLGDEAVGMTDAQVEDLVALVEGLADIIIDTYISEHRRSAHRPGNLIDRAA